NGAVCKVDERVHRRVETGAQDGPAGAVPPADVVDGDAAGDRETPACKEGALPQTERVDSALRSRSEWRPAGSIPARDVGGADAAGGWEGACRDKGAIREEREGGDGRVVGVGCRDDAGTEREPGGAVPSRDVQGRSISGLLESPASDDVTCR